jgi:hypothetical protein
MSNLQFLRKHEQMLTNLQTASRELHAVLEELEIRGVPTKMEWWDYLGRLLKEYDILNAMSSDNVQRWYAERWPRILEEGDRIREDVIERARRHGA